MAAFYKAMWPVVGGEITRAIMDFFNNGWLLNKELFTGYNQQHLDKHCALEIDLRKAYDTVEWDFLFAAIRLLAFQRPLLDKIDRRIQGWGEISLSFEARVQLIKSVLMALNIDWAMAFILPKGIIKEIEKCLQNFMWKGVVGTGYSKVAWPQVCNPVDLEDLE
ncbi:UNVERIFIED_CONTAM: hypothetical protein Sradi_1556100 [Sesamum radiatum]|uniref:Reverse transcriptase domain-containing protein n=1 Tax=Sesamum radiatum TaxID=300843 RepID=A0AAW2U8M7_SESRA